MKRFKVAAIMVLVPLASVAAAQGLVPVRPLDGYGCMRLRMTHEQAIDRSYSVSVRAGPGPKYPEIGIASAIVLVRSPSNRRDGYDEVLFPTGQVGWIESRALMPFQTQDFPRATCTPSLMSNGRPGFKITTNQ